MLNWNKMWHAWPYQKVKKAFESLYKSKNVGRLEVLKDGRWNWQPECICFLATSLSLIHKHVLVLQWGRSWGAGGLWAEPEPSSPQDSLWFNGTFPPAGQGNRGGLAVAARRRRETLQEEGSECSSPLLPVAGAWGWGWQRVRIWSSCIPCLLRRAMRGSGGKCWTPFSWASRSTIAILNDHFCLSTGLRQWSVPSSASTLHHRNSQ